MDGFDRGYLPIQHDQALPELLREANPDDFKLAVARANRDLDWPSPGIDMGDAVELGINELSASQHEFKIHIENGMSRALHRAITEHLKIIQGSGEPADSQEGARAATRSYQEMAYHRQRMIETSRYLEDNLHQISRLMPKLRETQEAITSLKDRISLNRRLEKANLPPGENSGHLERELQHAETVAAKYRTNMEELESLRERARKANNDSIQHGLSAIEQFEPIEAHQISMDADIAEMADRLRTAPYGLAFGRPERLTTHRPGGQPSGAAGAPRRVSPPAPQRPPMQPAPPPETAGHSGSGDAGPAHPDPYPREGRPTVSARVTPEGPGQAGTSANLAEASSTRQRLEDAMARTQEMFQRRQGHDMQQTDARLPESLRNASPEDFQLAVLRAKKQLARRYQPRDPQAPRPEGSAAAIMVKADSAMFEALADTAAEHLRMIQDPAPGPYSREFLQFQTQHAQDFYQAMENFQDSLLRNAADISGARSDAARLLQQHSANVRDLSARVRGARRQNITTQLGRANLEDLESKLRSANAELQELHTGQDSILRQLEAQRDALATDARFAIEAFYRQSTFYRQSAFGFPQGEVPASGSGPGPASDGGDSELEYLDDPPRDEPS